MKSTVLAAFDLPWLPALAMLLFLAVFLGALAWVSRRGSAEFYERLQNLPLDEEKSA